MYSHVTWHLTVRFDLSNEGFLQFKEEHVLQVFIQRRIFLTAGKMYDI